MTKKVSKLWLREIKICKITDRPLLTMFPTVASKNLSNDI